ncbi:UvrD-helicase domain-containing protein [Candidatus Rhabdochlamydia sp. T3358]|uniref:UvrD-helicase domain-containing protein n=1 Tax=Candidatus Rhabdochlamydia sp. T3358 TaxID=2099795 RepID=UPI0010B84BD3|nr:UvrD-helicase domain-containing protein [Candidatus Rhabdochlamydia sp. T3358]VHN99560.1 RecBCD enzyme subunit RecB [Candidatus Rhabdochlamydia sp. T3358]
MKEFDILDRNLPIFGPHFLEASAGTGKTFAIEHLVARLILEAKDPIAIEQILVVTFTREATRELKRRIRQNLQRLYKNIREKSSDLDYLKAILEKGNAALLQAQERIESALIFFDNASIYTLHSFCYKLIQEFAFETQNGFNLNDPDEHAYLSTLQYAVKQVLRTEMKSPLYSPNQVHFLLSQYKFNPEHLLNHLMQVTKEDRKLDPFPSFIELYQQFLSVLPSLSSVCSFKFVEEIQQLSAVYKQMTDKNYLKEAEVWGRILETKTCSLEEFDALLTKNSFLEKITESNRKIRAKAAVFTYADLFKELQNYSLPLLQQAKDPKKNFLRLCALCQAKSQLLLQKADLYFPDTIVSRVHQALIEHPELKEQIQNKFQAVIIDEFQDTDKTQWQLFHQLFTPKMQTFCLVGDPKQSIYAFRKADLYTYLSAAKIIGKDHLRYLNTNYRSSFSLIEVLNKLLTKTNSWMPIPELQSYLDVHSVHPINLNLPYVTAPVHLFVAKATYRKRARWPTISTENQQLFAFIAQEIKQLQIHYHTPKSKIAILVKDRYQAARMVSFLSSQGIASNFKRGVALTQSNAYFGFKEILTAVLDPTDSSKIKTALGTPIIGWTEQQLIQDWKHPCFGLAKIHFQALKTIWEEKGFSCFFHSLLHTYFDPDISVLQKLLSSKQTELYLDLTILAEMLIEQEMQGYQGISLLRALNDIQNTLEEGRFATPSQQEEDSVRVMTIFMSKGLEFDAVFALVLASRQKTPDYIAIKDQLIPSDLEDPRCQLALEEADAEKMRQLYVALTRAKYHLYIPVILDQLQIQIQLAEASPIELFLSNWLFQETNWQKAYTLIPTITQDSIASIISELQPNITYSLCTQIESLPPSSKTVPPILIEPEGILLNISSEHWLSFTSIAQLEKKQEKQTHSFIEQNTLCSMPLGAETGNIIHHILEQCFKLHYHCPIDSHKISLLIHSLLQNTLLKDWQQVIEQAILSILKEPLLIDQISLSLSELTSDQMQQEMEFVFPIKEGMMKGFIDLCFEYQGKYYLLDWKTNYLGPDETHYSEEELITEMNRCNYLLQASIYATALKKHIQLFDLSPFEAVFGGAIYYFIRGKKFYHFYPTFME